MRLDQQSDQAIHSHPTHAVSGELRMQKHKTLKTPGQTLLISLTALGVVFGDIGTSPLYALKEAVKAASSGGIPSPDAVLGVESLILWSLFLIISIKYAILILRADNNGEGGILALLALVSPRRAKTSRARNVLIIFGLVGAALLYGDGAITPAISVLSAIEGLKVYAPQLTPVVIPLTLTILVLLFLVQRKGTEWVGNIFGPVMLLWFLTIAILGVRGITTQPDILFALNPVYAMRYLIHAGPLTLAVVGAVFLAVTGGEALYADMGHFGRVPMRLAWFVVALPSLVLNYLGQGGLLLSRPEAIDNPFYQLAPEWTHYGLVAFATAATVIASQAIISGAYSLTQQAMQLGFLPRMHIVHTASHERGQIYVPSVNWLLASATIAAVIGFGSSDALAGAYGVAVSLLMAITTLLATLIALRWRFNPWLVLPVNGVFLAIDLVFFGANSLKIMEGGWFPLLLAAAIAFFMITWRRGQEIARKARMALRPSIEEFVQELKADPPYRIRGTGMFLSSAKAGVPLLLTHHLRHNHVLHQNAFLVCAVTDPRPRVPAKERVEVTTTVEGIKRMFLHFGFMETPDVPGALALAFEEHAIDMDLKQVTYYLGRETIISGDHRSGMARWRENLFAFMNRNAERSGAYFRVPSRQVVEIGIEIEI
jgi:KUP system potassium uptake protein